MRAIIIFLSLVLTSCQATNMQTYVDPNFDNSRYMSVVVVGWGMNWQERRLIENAAVQSFEAISVRAIPSMTLLPPTREFSNEEVSKVLHEAGVETILVIFGGEKSISSTYVPPTYTPGTTTTTATTSGTVNTYGNYGTFNANTTATTTTSPGYSTSGYTIEKPRATYSAELRDSESDLVIWKANALSKGNAFSNFDALAKSMAKKSVAKLREDGLF